MADNSKPCLYVKRADQKREGEYVLAYEIC